MVEKLDLDLALRRTLHDLDETNFLDRPIAVKILEREPERLKTELEQEVGSKDGYQPSPAVPFLVPKAGGLVRNGRHLTIRDRIVYNACVSTCQPKIYGALEWSQGTVDLGYQMTDDHRLEGWFEQHPYKYWEQFRLDSLDKLKESAWLVEADIASYYDNIDVPHLISDLEEVEVNQKIRQLLKVCLQKWSVFGDSKFYGRGIPQSCNASHILAKLYLNSFDEYLSGVGLNHLRYNDDIRVFCDTVHSARNAVKEIVSYLSHRGLSLQSAKTRITDAEEAASVESILLCKSPGLIENEKGPRAALGLDMLTKAEPNPHMRDDPFYRSKRRGTRKDPARRSRQRFAHGEGVQSDS